MTVTDREFHSMYRPCHTFAGSSYVLARVPGGGRKRTAFSPVEIASHILLHSGEDGLSGLIKAVDTPPDSPGGR